MGNKLFSEVTGLTGLPDELIGTELAALLEDKGLKPEQLTLDQLREVLADYLSELALEWNEEEVPPLAEGEDKKLC